MHCVFIKKHVEMSYYTKLCLEWRLFGTMGRQWSNISAKRITKQIPQTYIRVYAKDCAIYIIPIFPFKCSIHYFRHKIIPSFTLYFYHLHLFFLIEFLFFIFLFFRRRICQWGFCPHCHLICYDISFISCV